MAATLRVNTVNLTPKAVEELMRFAAKFSDEVVITDGYLRDDVALSGSTLNLIPFNITQQGSGSSPGPNAQRLKADDAFLARDITVNFGWAASTSGVTSAAQQNAMTLYTNQKAATFPFVAGDVTAIQQAYNGWLSIKQGSITYFEQLAMREFYRSGVAQAGAVIFTAGTYFTDTWDSMNYGWYPLDGTQLRMSGRKNYAININGNQPMAFTAVSGSAGTTYAVLRIRGYLATGGASALDND
jgi:hypothetical protein